jgi:hypothetical protein
MNDKSQTSAEFIIIIAIVMVLAIILLIISNNTKKVITSHDTSSLIWSSTALGIEVFEIGTTSVIHITNNLPNFVTIQNITYTTDQTYTITTNQNVTTKQTKRISFTDPISCTSGDTLIGSIEINYNTTAYITETITFENKNYEIICN